MSDHPAGDDAPKPPEQPQTESPPAPTPPKPGRGGKPPAGLSDRPAADKPRKPSEGRIVHYMMRSGDGSGVLVHRPAMVTRLVGAKGRVDLSVFIARSDFPKNTHPGALLMIENVTFDDAPEPGENTWHWPEHI